MSDSPVPVSDSSRSDKTSVYRFSRGNLGSIFYQIEGDIPGIELVPEEDRNAVLNACGVLIAPYHESVATEISIKDMGTHYDVIAYGCPGRIYLSTLCAMKNHANATDLSIGLEEEPSIKGDRRGAIIASIKKSSAPPDIVNEAFVTQNFPDTTVPLPDQVLRVRPNFDFENNPPRKKRRLQQENHDFSINEEPPRSGKRGNANKKKTGYFPNFWK